MPLLCIHEQGHSQGGGFKRVHDSIRPQVWSRRFVAKFVKIQFGGWSEGLLSEPERSGGERSEAENRSPPRQHWRLAVRPKTQAAAAPSGAGWGHSGVWGRAPTAGDPLATLLAAPLMGPRR